MKVLIVEGDSHLAASVKRTLRSWGHEADRCARGKDALRMLRKTAYDLVLTEALLPDMEGDELISQLKGDAPETQFVAMARNNSRELETRIRELGILYYMIKPFETESLRSLLEHLSRKPSANRSCAETFDDHRRKKRRHGGVTS